MAHWTFEGPGELRRRRPLERRRRLLVTTENRKSVVPAEAGTQKLDSRRPPVKPGGGNDQGSPSHAEFRLMNRIHRQWGAAIDAACQYSSVPRAFLAALMALESGGDPAAKRFERHVYNKLINVQRGFADHYGALSHGELKRFSNDGIRNFATSWGLTQVMGYHVARRPGGIELLINPETHLKFALGMLAEFAERFGLNATQEFAELLRCWNTGAPYDDPSTPRIEGRTHDPHYVANGLRRMEIYKRILSGGNKASGEKPVAIFATLGGQTS